MLESFVLVATLVLANGEAVEAYGDEYPTYQSCVRENEKEMNRIKADIKKRPNVFKDMTYKCEHYMVTYPKTEGVSIDE